MAKKPKKPKYSGVLNEETNTIEWTSPVVTTTSATDPPPPPLSYTLIMGAIMTLTIIKCLIYD